MIKDILFGVLGNTAYEFLKSIAMKIFKINEDNDIIIQNLISATKRAAEKFFTQYGEEFGKPESSFLSIKKNWELIYESVYYGKGEIRPEQILTSGLGYDKSSIKLAIRDFVKILEEEMHSDRELDKIMVEKLHISDNKEIKNEVEELSKFVRENLTGSITASSHLNRVIYELNNQDYPNAEKVISNFLRSIEYSNPDPNWKYRIEIDENDVNIIEEPLDKSILESLPKRLETKIVIPKEYYHLKTFRNLIKYGQHKQIPIRLELKGFKEYVGEHLIRTETSKFKNNIILEIPPTPFPIINSRFVFNNGTIKIDHIELQVLEIIDDFTIKIGNRKQKDKLLLFEFIINSQTNELIPTIEIPEEKESNVESNYLSSFIEYLGKKGKIFLEVFFEQEPFFNAYIQITGAEIDKKTIRLYKDLLSIEKHFNLNFALPEVISQDDIYKIAYLKKIINSGIIINTIVSEPTLTTNDINTLNNIIKISEKGSSFQVIIETAQINIKLFNLTINLGERLVIIPPMHLKNIDKLKMKVKLFSEGDSVCIESKIDSNNQTTHIYPLFTKKDPKSCIKVPYVVEIKKDIEEIETII